MRVRRQWFLVVVAAVMGGVGCGHTEGAHAVGAGGTSATVGAGASATADGTSSTNGMGGSGGTSGSTGASTGTSGAAGMGGSTHDFGDVSTAAEMCRVLPAARAEYQARCHGGTPEEWLSTLHPSCAATERSEKAGRITFDKERAEACLAFLANDDCIFQPGEVNPCDSLVTGSIAEEEPCESLGFGDECAPGLYCTYIEDCFGRCRAYAQVAETCHGNFVTAVCAPGLQCDGPSAACLVPGAAGQACTGDGLCETGYYCEREEGTSGICRPRKTEGPCSTDGECVPGFDCRDDGSGQAQCVRPKAAGETCRFGMRECAGHCSLGGVCRVVSQEAEPCGYLRDSEDDTLSESMSCAAGLMCDRISGSEGICVQAVPLGETCPATLLSGLPCQQGDEMAYCGDSGRCVSCG